MTVLIKNRDSFKCKHSHLDGLVVYTHYHYGKHGKAFPVLHIHMNKKSQLYREHLKTSFNRLKKEVKIYPAIQVKTNGVLLFGGFYRVPESLNNYMTVQTLINQKVIRTKRIINLDGSFGSKVIMKGSHSQIYRNHIMQDIPDPPDNLTYPACLCNFDLFPNVNYLSN